MLTNLPKYSAIVLLSALTVAGCSPPSRVSVEERQTIDPRMEAEKIGGSRIRIVQPGDTLHAIAFENALSVNKLAAWNQLKDTSKLKIGQRVRLTRPVNFIDPSARVAQTTAASSKTNDRSRALSENPIVARPLVSSRANSGEADKIVVKEQKKEQIQRSQAPADQRLNWRWPVEGKLLEYFSTKTGKQGIDIQGQPGQAVLAASSGQIVYVGNGLKGYGNLIIIKHNDLYLSAYAHNQVLFAKEGQHVDVSQRIALLGKDNKRRDVLHFQIRRDGQPVNPLTYLPKR